METLGYEEGDICKSVLLIIIVLIHSADLIRDIKDPEHPHTLEELNVISERSISVDYRTGALCASTPFTSKTESSGQGADMIFVPRGAIYSKMGGCSPPID